MKQVIVVNEALKLPRGKLAAQVAHASVAALLEATADARRRWVEDGMPQVVLHCEWEEELVQRGAADEAAGRAKALSRGAGHTGVAGCTGSWLGVGQASAAAGGAV